MSDFDDVFKLAADLSNAPSEANSFVDKAIRYTATEMKMDWRQGASVQDYYPETYAAAISYDMKYDGSSIEAEIGPVLGRTPGASAGFLEEAPGGVDGPAHHAGRDAVEANEADFYRGVEIALFDATRKAVEG